MWDRRSPTTARRRVLAQSRETGCACETLLLFGTNSGLEPLDGREQGAEILHDRSLDDGMLGVEVRVRELVAHRRDVLPRDVGLGR